MGNRLGSFEGYGVSLGNLGFGNSEGFGSAASDLPRNKKYLSQVQADHGLAMNTMGAPTFGNAPQNWQYWEFKGKPSSYVYSNAPRKMAELHKKIQAAGPQTAGSRRSRRSSSATSSSSSGPDAGEVLTGIAAILAPLTQAGVGIYAASRKGRNPTPTTPTPRDQNQTADSGSNTGLIIGIAVVVLLIGGFMMMSKKQAPMYGPIHRPGGYRKRKRGKKR